MGCGQSQHTERELIELGCFQEFRKRIDDRPALINNPDGEGELLSPGSKRPKETLLHVACRFDRVEFLLFLLQRGGSTTTPDYRNRTPFHLAAQCHSYQCLRALTTVTMHEPTVLCLEHLSTFLTAIDSETGLGVDHIVLGQEDGCGGGDGACAKNPPCMILDRVVENPTKWREQLPWTWFNANRGERAPTRSQLLETTTCEREVTDAELLCCIADDLPLVVDPVSLAILSKPSNPDVAPTLPTNSILASMPPPAEEGPMFPLSYRRNSNGTATEDNASTTDRGAHSIDDRKSLDTSSSRMRSKYRSHQQAVAMNKGRVQQAEEEGDDGGPLALRTPCFKKRRQLQKESEGGDVGVKKKSNNAGQQSSSAKQDKMRLQRKRRIQTKIFLRMLYEYTASLLVSTHPEIRHHSMTAMTSSGKHAEDLMYHALLLPQCFDLRLINSTMASRSMPPEARRCSRLLYSPKSGGGSPTGGNGQMIKSPPEPQQQQYQRDSPSSVNGGGGQQRNNDTNKVTPPLSPTPTAADGAVFLTPVLSAIFFHQVEVFRRLLILGGREQLLSGVDSIGNTALHLALAALEWNKGERIIRCLAIGAPDLLERQRRIPNAEGLLPGQTAAKMDELSHDLPPSMLEDNGSTPLVHQKDCIAPGRVVDEEMSATEEDATSSSNRKTRPGGDGGAKYAPHLLLSAEITSRPWLEAVLLK